MTSQPSEMRRYLSCRCCKLERMTIRVCAYLKRCDLSGAIIDRLWEIIWAFYYHSTPGFEKHLTWANRWHCFCAKCSKKFKRLLASNKFDHRHLGTAVAGQLSSIWQQSVRAHQLRKTRPLPWHILCIITKTVWHIVKINTWFPFTMEQNLEQTIKKTDFKSPGSLAVNSQVPALTYSVGTCAFTDSRC